MPSNHLPYTEEDAEAKGWPCYMCDHDTSLPLRAGAAWAEAYKNFCSQCTRATIHAKPSKFELGQKIGS